jgi:hypothetical protein
MVSWFMQDSQESHLKVVKINVCCIKGTYKLGIKYCNAKMKQLVNYIGLDWVGDGDDMKSTFGCVSTWPKTHCLALKKPEGSFYIDHRSKISRCSAY